MIVAGNVAGFDQIRKLGQNGIWAFTIGGAVLEKRFVRSGTNKDQIQAVLKNI